VDGSLAYGCTQSFQVESAVTGGPVFPNEALRCEATRGEGSRRRRKVRSPAGGVRNTTLYDAGSIHPPSKADCPQKRTALKSRKNRDLWWSLSRQIQGVRDAQSPAERSEEEQRNSCRTKALWTGKSFAPSRWRGGSGLGESLRIGPTCTAKGTHRYRGRIATGASEVGRRVQRQAQQAP